MRNLTLADLASLASDTASWATCILVTRPGESVRMTSHDKALTVDFGSPNELDLSGEYVPLESATATQIKSGGDLSVDNLEVDIKQTDRITMQQIRAGRFNDARFVLFIVNWQDPTDSGIILKRGPVGNFADYLEGAAQVELRGFKQYLQQVIVEAAGPTCRYKLGDERCGVDLTSFTQTGTVTGIAVQRRKFESAIPGSPSPPAGWWGEVTWLTGSNTDLVMEVKLDEGNGDLTMFEPLPFDIQVGDTFSVTPSCDHAHGVVADVAIGDCGPKFDNIVNFGGEPFIPNQNSLVEAAD